MVVVVVVFIVLLGAIDIIECNFSNDAIFFLHRILRYDIRRHRPSQWQWRRRFFCGERSVYEHVGETSGKKIYGGKAISRLLLLHLPSTTQTSPIFDLNPHPHHHHHGEEWAGLAYYYGKSRTTPHPHRR